MVCARPLPVSPGGTKLEFLKHPFFDTERMCPCHAPGGGSGVVPASATALGETRRCAGCHRFEPRADPTRHFVDVGDADTGRCVCMACLRKLVTDSADARLLWARVLDFFEGPLGLIAGAEGATGGVTRRALQAIPVLVVGGCSVRARRRQETR